MPDIESIMTTHYRAVREEEIERIRLRDRYLVWYATTSAAAAGMYLKDASWWGLLATILALTVVAGFLYAHTDVTLGSLSQWLRHTYSRALREYRTANEIGFDLPHWDGSEVHREYVRSVGFAMRYITVAIFLAGVGSLATWVAWDKSDPAVRIVMILLVALGAGAPLWAWIKRISQT